MKKYATLIQCLFTLTLYFLGACLFAGALTPSVLLTLKLLAWIKPATLLMKAFTLALGFGFGFFIFGVTLALETVLVKIIFNLKLKEGEYEYFSPQGMKWAFVNSMILIVNLSFMDFMRLTPLLPLYYKLMGAKIGKRVQINTKGVADASLIEIGDDSVLGGDAVVIGHLAEHGKIKLKKTIIGKKVTIGLGAVIMPGAVIGDRSIIAARSVLSKNSIVEAHSVYAGTPARFVKNLDEK